jgi:hypothetical protein
MLLPKLCQDPLTSFLALFDVKFAQASVLSPLSQDDLTGIFGGKIKGRQTRCAPQRIPLREFGEDG